MSEFLPALYTFMSELLALEHTFMRELTSESNNAVYATGVCS